MNRGVRAGLIVGVAGTMMPAAGAINSRIDLLVSTDGEHFAPSVVAGPGVHTIEVIVRVTYTGELAPLGFASMVFQPTVSNFGATDSTLAFVNAGMGSNTSTPPGTVSDVPGAYGRVSPFAKLALTSTTAITSFVQTGPGSAADPTPSGRWLRVARASTTAWIGGTGNTTGGGGVPVGQFNQAGRTASEPAFNPSLSVTVFRFGFRVDGDIARPDMVIDIPQAGMGNRETVTGERQVYWYESPADEIGFIRGGAVVNPARVIFVPGPWGGAVLLCAVGLAVPRRR